MNAPKFEIVPFEDHHILTAEHAGQVTVVVKPIVEKIGLKWHGQFERIKRHPVLAKGVRVTRIPTAGGAQDMVCLELTAFHGWLATISPDRIPNQIAREMVLRYQETAFRVLFEHFHGHDPADAEAHQPATEPVEASLFDPARLTAAVAVVREARRLFGLRAARAIWPRLGLPLPEPDGTMLDDGLAAVLTHWLIGKDRFAWADLGHGLGLGLPDLATRRRLHDMLVARGWCYKNTKFGSEQRWTWHRPVGPIEGETVQ